MRFVITLILIFTGTVAFCQVPALTGQDANKSEIEFNGGKYSGYTIQYNASPDIVEEAIKQQFKQLGTKAKETKGFMVYRNVVLTSIDPSKPLDAFIKVERKSKKEKDLAIVYFIATSAGEIPEEKLKSDAAAKYAGISSVENSGAFLTNLKPDVVQGVYEKDLADQQNQVKKEEKTLANLVDDQGDLEKKLKKLQNDIEYNKKAQERQTAEVEKAKAKLNDLMTNKPVRPIQ